MADTSRLNDVLESFREWGRPWDYILAVLAKQGLQSSVIRLIIELWTEATDATYWLEPSFKTLMS
jgi:hypothetical protein